MTFVSKNPLVLPQSNSSPSSLPTGTCGLYPSSDGWYSIDASGNARRILINDTSDIGENAVAIGVNIDMEPNAACSQAFGRNLIVSSSGQTVLGENNVEDENGEYVVIVGNGQSEARSNAFALKKNGDGYFGGDVISQTGGKLSEKAEKTTVDEMSSELQKTAKLDTNNNFAGAQTISGTLTVNGDIVQNGESYISHAEEIYTKKDLIKTREGAVGGLGIDELTGIEAEKYDGENNGRLGFGADGTARVGDVGDEQPLLTRAEVADLTDGQVFVWDSTNKRAIGSSGYALKTTVAEDISTAKTEAAESANQYTDSQAASALSSAKAYTDEKIDEVTIPVMTESEYASAVFTEDKIVIVLPDSTAGGV